MHHCEAVLITCEDYRLHQRKDGRNYIADFIKSLGVDCDLITRAGGAQDLVRPQIGFDASIMRDAEVSAKLHNATRIHLINHQNCGAYGASNFSSLEAEREQHKKDLLLAREILNRRFPGKEIKIYFAELADKDKDVFEIKEIL
ncbi:MAG: hypothetical protein UW11_C0042G0003 [Parcubacteria group bacterium GW2011_GWA2_43_9b]|nr:MAG: hypothetical protein UW11_C0042G0003 [Parcubacteria group bacterium GW2011_GWA2_43_9b]